MPHFSDFGKVQTRPAISPARGRGKSFVRQVRCLGSAGLALAAAGGLLCCAPARAAQEQILKGHVPAAAKNQPALSRLAGSTHLDLAIGLPLRNPEQLTNLLEDIYRPGSPNYHRYLTPEQFTTAYAPTESDYQAVIDFATAHGLKITGTHPNRTLVDVNGSVDAIEQALHVHMGVYQHPTQARTFYAPDAEPSISLDTPLLRISGLDDFTRPYPKLRKSALQDGKPRSGSGSGGSYLGNDFRAAYAPGVSLTGAGQSVGVFELDGYFASDITAYETLAKLPRDVPLTNILIDGWNGGASLQNGDDEVCLDIEMAIAMAPGLSRVLVYEASPTATTANINDLLNRMATDDKASQLSCSWGFDINASTEQIFQQLAAQGQSFFLASGDNGAFVGPVEQPSDDPYITVVGGTTLSTSGPGGGWRSETTWNAGDGATSSGGGISITYPIPLWQQGVSMSANRGSTTMRNVPDVSMLGADVWVTENGTGAAYDGTSVSAPLWAGFAALVNQQGAAAGRPPVGFINPALYAIARSSRYSSAFHDITTGNNTSAASPNQFYAVAGYDLCTGWGSPTGANMINDLLTPPSDGLLITPQLGFTAGGPVRGPFNVSSQTYTLTNAGAAPLNWSLVNTSLWLTVSPPSGTLTPGGPAATVTAALNSTATNQLIVSYDANVWFSNLTDNAGQDREFYLLVGNGGFETGDFTDWKLSGTSSAANNFVLSTDDSFQQGSDTVPGVDDSAFVHSGLYGAFLGQLNSVAHLSQTVPTVAGRQYLVSFWLTSIAANGITTPNQFNASWNGATLYSQSDLPAFGWTYMQYIAPATGPNTTLQFGFEDDPAGLGLDDITVQAIPAPDIQSVTEDAGTISFTWGALPGLSYQVQYTADLGSPNWTNLGGALSATTGTLSASDSNPSDSQRFYRVVLIP